MRNDRLAKTLGLAPFSFQSETLISKISRQKATTDILMANGFSAVRAHDVFEQFFRWNLAPSVDPSVKTQRDPLYTTKWQTKMFIPFRLMHAQTNCLYKWPCTIVSYARSAKLYRGIIKKYFFLTWGVFTDEPIIGDKDCGFQDETQKQLQTQLRPHSNYTTGSLEA